MNHNEPNPCIACLVDQCAHHCGDQNYCSLDKITVGAHVADPTLEQFTDCMSYEKK